MFRQGLLILVVLGSDKDFGSDHGTTRWPGTYTCKKILTTKMRYKSGSNNLNDNEVFRKILRKLKKKTSKSKSHLTKMSKHGKLTQVSYRRQLLFGCLNSLIENFAYFREI